MGMEHKKIAGERIRAARKAAGYKSRKELADQISGLTPSTLGNYEQGLRYPPPRILIELARLLGEPASYLGALDDDPGRINLDRKYARMDQRGKDTLHRVAESQPVPYGSDDQSDHEEESA